MFHWEIWRSLGRIAAPMPQIPAGWFSPTADRPMRMPAEDFHALV